MLPVRLRDLLLSDGIIGLKQFTDQAGRIYSLHIYIFARRLEEHNMSKSCVNIDERKVHHMIIGPPTEATKQEPGV